MTDTLLRSMEVKVNRQRLDSTHVLSDMATLGRAQVIGVALRRFFHRLEKHDARSGQAALLDHIIDDLLKRYRKQSDSRIFADARTTELRRVALQQAAEDLCLVINELHQTGGHVIVNPSDPDATYSGHKGAGHQVQIAETFNEDGDPNFITSAIVETAADNDADAVLPVLEDLKKRDVMPEEMRADTAYGGDANVQSAKEQAVHLVARVPGAKKCGQCPLLEHCRVHRNRETQEPTGRIQFTGSAVRADVRRREEQSDEFRDRYRWRSGIEGTNGCLKRMMGLGRLRVRGHKAVKLSILLKLAGWNLLRAIAMRRQRNNSIQMTAN